MGKNRALVHGLVYRKDCGILFDPRSGVVFQLDDIGREIVEISVNGKSADETASVMAKKYGVDFAIVRNDVSDFWGELKNGEIKPDLIELEKNSENMPDFPFNLEVALTRLCNLKCSFCHDSLLHEKGSDPHLPLAFVVSLLDEAAEAGLLRIRYSGGEPTLHPGFSEILSHGNNLGLYQIIFTNGLRIDQQTLSSWKRWNVQEVLISLHGGERVHDELTGAVGSYRKTLLAVEMVQASGIGLVVEMTLTRKNSAEIFSVIDTIGAMGVNEFRLMRYVARGEADDLFSFPVPALPPLLAEIDRRYGKSGITIRFPCSQKFCLSESNVPIGAGHDFKMAKKYLVQNCYAGVNWASISSDGKLRLCPHARHPFANLLSRRQPFEQVWKEKVLGSVRKNLSRRKNGCETCSAWSYCLGGCYLNDFEAD